MAKIITAKINDKSVKIKAYKTASFGAYEFAWVKYNGKHLKLRRRAGNVVYFYYQTL